MASRSAGRVWVSKETSPKISTTSLNLISLKVRLDLLMYGFKSMTLPLAICESVASGNRLECPN